jgi:curved DNA-binding protein
MSKRDFYEVLGVPRSASQEEIRKSYKKLARQLHPDVKPSDPNAAKAFSEITEAWEVLGDEEKRRKYDQFGHGFQNAGGPFQGGGSPFQGFQGGAQVDLDDILGGMFGGGFGGGGRQRGARPKKGEDARAEITVPFSVAAEGGEHELTLQHGHRSERITVRIPAGVDHGQTIRLAGQGNPGTGGAPGGDLLVTVQVAPHPWFRREGSNLLVDVPVSPSEAALGAKIDVPTLSEGQMVLNIPAGTSSGARLRLRGKGLRNPKTGERGDQFVILKIAVPKDLSDEAKSLYRQLAEFNPDNPRSSLWQQR